MFFPNFPSIPAEIPSEIDLMNHTEIISSTLVNIIGMYEIIRERGRICETNTGEFSIVDPCSMGIPIHVDFLSKNLIFYQLGSILIFSPRESLVIIPKILTHSGFNPKFHAEFYQEFLSEFLPDILPRLSWIIFRDFFGSFFRNRSHSSSQDFSRSSFCAFFMKFLLFAQNLPYIILLE